MRNRIKIFIFLCIGLIVTNYLDLNTIKRKTSLVKENQTITGQDTKIQGNCFIIQNDFNGIRQWGNSIYFLTFSLMYLLRNGASIAVFRRVTNRKAIPLGTNFDDAIFGPKADQFNEEGCYEWDPLMIYREQGAMQDIMDLRDDWETFTSNWPKNEDLKINNNPFHSDFGVSPSLPELATNSLGINWEDVLVLHIRQGDVMKVAYPPINTFVHSQPPCAYYEDVIETGYNGAAFPHLLIITNPQEDEESKNPCAGYLKDRYSSGLHTTKIVDYDAVLNLLKADDSVPHVYDYLRMDLHILSTAINIAEGHSTFTMGTTMLNTQLLKRHFVPANPSTINCVWPFSTTLSGNHVYRRQYYNEKVMQIQYILEDWQGFNASCDLINVNQLYPWRNELAAESKTWDIKVENITTKMLEYPRSKLLKYKTSDKPFECASSTNPLMTADSSKWFVPCVCRENVVDHILSSE